MNDLPDDPSKFASVKSRARPGLAVLLFLHIVTCCLSLIYVAEFYAYLQIIMFDKVHLSAAAFNIALFAVASLLFMFGQFSFGYFIGFYFYTIILGYLWLVTFSKYGYDHIIASSSAFASALAFLMPALFNTSPIQQRFVLSMRALDNLLYFILILAVTIIATGAFYNFRLVGFIDIYSFRDELEFPAWSRYAIGATSHALLPFAFACFVARRNRWCAAATLLLFLMFYPITLTKMVLFAPFWLLFLAMLSRLFEARTAVVLSLLLPLSVGVALMLLFNSGMISYDHVRYYFGAVNFRMIAIPSIAIDLYSDFFSTHDHTYFCQISILKPFVSCPYSEYLSIIMAKAYNLGNLNASLFATEGIASVGPVLAPFAAFVCGLAISLGNRVSFGLPSEFVLLSGGMLLQSLVNVPLTTTLLTNGGALLFMLWYITPRAMFERKADRSATSWHRSIASTPGM